MNRFFVSPDAFGSEYVQLPAETAFQIRKVLRLREGEAADFLDGLGNVYHCVIEYASEKEPAARILGKEAGTGEPPVSVRLYFGMTQREKAEWILQKCTESGVTHFIPMITERSLVRSGRDLEGKLDRWQKILKEAAEQCGRARVPQITAPVPFVQAVGQCTDPLKLFCWEEEKQQTLHELITAHPGDVSLMIGPEGGFSEKEADLARENGWKSVTLGPRIYRMETAAVAASVLILYEIEAFQAAYLR